MRYYLNIGTNLGDRHDNLRRAIAALTGGTGNCTVSPVVESEPWGFESENRFLNVGIALDSDLEPLVMLDRIHDIERSLGSAAHRDAQGGYIDRLVDIDIMAIDDSQGNSVTIDLPTLQVPHPHLYDRDFFIGPYRWLKDHAQCSMHNAQIASQSAGRQAHRTLGEAMLYELPYNPTDEQMQLIALLDRFVQHGGDRTVFLLTGYAGTGKTSIIGALVRALRARLRKCVLMAPTGRAAHIMSDYSGHTAWTIHRKIYRQQSYGSDTFGLAENRHTDTLFIVDEASMIANGVGEGAIFGTGQLLDDLITYVYSGQNCRLLLVGDTAQLPPVGATESVALNPAVLRGYGLDVMGTTLRQTARQTQESGILHNATLLRQAMEQEHLVEPHLQLEGFTDIATVTGDMLLETISDCYDRDGIDQTIIISRSNWRATQFNAGVRNQILYREEELASGDLLLVVKNNYYWAEDYEKVDFVANGDVAIVRRVRGEVERRYGLCFATVVLELPDHEGTEMEAKVVLDCLLSDTSALTRPQQERLFNEVMAELPGDQRSRLRALKRHPYFNALQVKMAYAVTCHKAQGGQWQNVFIDMGGIPREALSTLDFYRWFYTALTRARSRVYLINYSERQ